MSTDPVRTIAHLDMDAFYASVELIRYPQLRGRALVIGGGRGKRPDGSTSPEQAFSPLRDYIGRGVITTASYEARALGLHSGMGLMKAAQLAPDAVRLPTDFDEYRRYSHRFKAAVRAIAPEIEDSGIDEIYIDLTGIELPRDDLELRDPATDAWDRACEAAQAIKQAVDASTGLSCSIGIASNKLLAKIASDLDKPDGLTVITPSRVATRVWPLPTRKINGIGPKAAAKLEALGVRTIGELARADPAWLISHFGKHYGAWLHDAAHGRDDRPVVTFSEPKSISRETTFDRDLHATRDRDELSRIFTELCVDLSDDLRHSGYAGKTIGVKIRYDNFHTLTRDHTIAAPTQDARIIRRAAGTCLKRVPLDRRIRLLGVRVGALSPADGEAHPLDGLAEPSLFD
ncbi:MAG: DNA polymerase IV [Betaproteobacteria bacterium]|nr:MAG: DNA polymerase IV [Betaproteobacteria bacterium]